MEMVWCFKLLMEIVIVATRCVGWNSSVLVNDFLTVVHLNIAVKETRIQ